MTDGLTAPFAAVTAKIPEATAVSPMTESEIFNILAMEEESSTRKLAPKIRRTKPNTNNMYVHLAFAVLSRKQN